MQQRLDGRNRDAHDGTDFRMRELLETGQHKGSLLIVWQLRNGLKEFGRQLFLFGGYSGVMEFGNLGAGGVAGQAQSLQKGEAFFTFPAA